MSLFFKLLFDVGSKFSLYDFGSGGMRVLKVLDVVDKALENDDLLASGLKEVLDFSLRFKFLHK